MQPLYTATEFLVTIRLRTTPTSSLLIILQPCEIEASPIQCARYYLAVEINLKNSFLTKRDYISTRQTDHVSISAFFIQNRGNQSIEIQHVYVRAYYSNRRKTRLHRPHVRRLQRVRENRAQLKMRNSRGRIFCRSILVVA